MWKKFKNPVYYKHNKYNHWIFPLVYEGKTLIPYDDLIKDYHIATLEERLKLKEILDNNTKYKFINHIRLLSMFELETYYKNGIDLGGNLYLGNRTIYKEITSIRNVVIMEDIGPRQSRSGMTLLNSPKDLFRIRIYKKQKP